MDSRIKEKVAELLRERKVGQAYCDMHAKILDKKLEDYKKRRVFRRWPDISVERAIIDKITLKCSQHYPEAGEEDREGKWVKYLKVLIGSQAEYMSAMRNMYHKMKDGPVGL